MVTLSKTYFRLIRLGRSRILNDSKGLLAEESTLSNVCLQSDRPEKERMPADFLIRCLNHLDLLLLMLRSSDSNLSSSPYHKAKSCHHPVEARLCQESPSFGHYSCVMIIVGVQNLDGVLNQEFCIMAQLFLHQKQQIPCRQSYKFIL